VSSGASGRQTTRSPLRGAAVGFGDLADARGRAFVGEGAGLVDPAEAVEVWLPVLGSHAGPWATTSSAPLDTAAARVHVATMLATIVRRRADT
jgi:hypothetical protein